MEHLLQPTQQAKCDAYLGDEQVRCDNIPNIRFVSYGLKLCPEHAEVFYKKAQK